MFGALYMYISALDILFGAWQNEKILHQTTGVPDITHSWLQSILWPFLTFLFLDLKMDPFLQMMKFIFHLLSIRFPYIWKHVCEKQKVFAYGVLSHLLKLLEYIQYMVDIFLLNRGGFIVSKIQKVCDFTK